MKDNYSPLTLHSRKSSKEANRAASKLSNAFPSTKPKAQAFTVPGIGVTIKLIHSLITKDAKPDSIARCRISYDSAKQEWSIRSVDGSGMLLFFDQIPHHSHTHVAITSVAANQTTCYGTTFQAHDYIE